MSAVVSEGEELSRAGQAQALASIDARVWMASAIRVAVRLAASGRSFTSEDITAEVGLPRQSGLSKNNAVGALLGSLSRRSLIVAVGHTKAERPISHAAMLTVWRGTNHARFPFLRRSLDMPATVYVDREELRRLLNQAPENVKARGRAIINGARAPLMDGSWDDEPDALYLLAAQIADAAEELGTTLRIPIDTEPYRSAFLALPIDLRDRVEQESRAYEIPNLAYPGKWRVEHAQALDRLLTEAAEDAAARMRRVHALLNAAGLDTDNARHEIIKQITGDDRESSKAITEPEADELERRLGLIESGAATYVAGSGIVLDATGELFGRYAPDWRAFCKVNGLTQKRLSELAREAARTLKLPDPTKAIEITDPRLTAALMRAGRVDNAARAVEEAFAEPEAEPEEAAQEPATDRRLSVVPNEPIEAPGGSGGPLVGVLSQAEPIWWAPVPISRIDAVLKALRG